MITLKDIAEKAGVSITTVSWVMNGISEGNHISDETSKRVMAAAEALGYKKNRSSSLPAQKKSIIALFWPIEAAYMLGNRLAQMNQALLDHEQNYEIVCYNYRYGRICEYILFLKKSNISGIVVGAASAEDVSQLEQMKISIPLVLINRDSNLLSTVSVNSSHIGTLAAVLLQKKSYKACAVVKGGGNRIGANTRINAFLFACEQLGIDLRPEWTFIAPPTISGGAAATEEYCSLKEKPTVIFYENDYMAQGGLCILQRRGMKVPDEIELFAIGSQLPELMEYTNPPITCISLPQHVDRQAVYTLIRLIEGKEKGPVHIELEPQLDIRKSYVLTEDIILS